MKNWTIARRLAVGFACVILLTLALGSFAWVRFTGLRKNIDDLAGNTLPSILILTECLSVVKDNMISAEEHFAADSDERMSVLDQQILDASARRVALFATYEKLLSDAEDARLFHAAKEALTRYTAVRTQMLNASRQQQKAEARKILETEVVPLYEAYAHALKADIDYNTKLGHAAGAAGEAAAKSAVRLIVVALAAATILGVALAWLIGRSINGVLRDLAETLGSGADQTAAAAGQVSASSQSLAEGASEQAASLEETSASLEEMASMTKHSAENAQQAKATASTARGSADAGTVQIQAMQAAMQAIKTASEDITKILKTIDEIAFQTNILALNAAVEAARAGEAGAGFAVVAEEVRALAQRCAAAAKETAVKIEDSVNKSHQGVQITADVAKSFADIQVKIQHLDQLVGEIATASNEQNQGIGQVTIAVSQMDKITQSSAGNAEETAAAAEELNGQTQMMKAAVERLQTLTGLRTAGGTQHFSEETGRPPAATRSQAPAPVRREPVPRPEKSSAETPAIKFNRDQLVHGGG